VRPGCEPTEGQKISEAAKMDETDEILYEKIDEILWLDWDPIGVNEFEVRDEYQSYTPAIYDLKKSGLVLILSQLLSIKSRRIRWV
jgi:hypothetical protein